LPRQEPLSQSEWQVVRLDGWRAAGVWDQPLKVGDNLARRSAKLIERQHFDPVKVAVEAPERLALGLAYVAADNDLGADFVRILVIAEPNFVAAGVDLFEVLLHLTDHHRQGRAGIVALVAVIEPE
jgi:hypothetical protein